MKIGKRWSAKLEEVSSGHFHCRAVDLDGRVIEIDGDDPDDIQRRIRIDAYLYDNMVLNKRLRTSLQGRSASRELAVFLDGYNGLDDSDDGWRAFLSALTRLKGMQSDLTASENTTVDQLHESLTSVFPLLLTGNGDQQAQQDVAPNA
jgi:hypothetical protein